MFLDYRLDVEEQSQWRIAQDSAEAAAYPFVLNESGLFYARRAFYTKRYAKNDYQLLYTVAGAACLDYEGQQWSLGEGSLVLIDCNQYHDYRTDPAVGHWTYYWIHVGGPFCERYYSLINPEGFAPQMHGLDPALRACFEAVLQSVDLTTDVAYVRMNQAVSDVLSRLVLHAQAVQPSPQEALVAEAVRYLQLHHAERVSIDDLAAHLNLSKFYFIKLFNQQMRMTPYRYLLLYRINESKKLLRATDHKVSEIALAVGFADSSNFSRSFTKLVGLSPAQYRRT